MGLQDVVWEIRSGGNNTNGGGFNRRIPGVSIDYSQQNGAELSLVDLVCAQNARKVTSATGGFTPGMIGSIMRINSGTNFTVDYYEIIQWYDTNTVYLDRSPATGGAGSGGNCKVGGALADPWDVMELSQGGVKTIYVADGTYTLDQDVIIPDRAIIRGYKDHRNVIATLNDRPLFQATSGLRIDYDDTLVHNIRHTQDSSDALDTDGVMFNCEFKLLTGASVRPIIGTGKFVRCWFEGNGSRANHGPYGAQFYNCYLKNFNRGIEVDSTNIVVNLAFCILNDCTYGLYNGIGANRLSRAVNTAFYNCTDGAYYSRPWYYLAQDILINCIFENCVDGIHHATANLQSRHGMVIRNCDFYNNTNNVNNAFITLDGSNLFVDPEFIDPGNDDFSIAETSALIGQGMVMRLGVT